jgi:predicted amidohydrolase YtcJ
MNQEAGMQYPEKIYYNGSIHTGNDFSTMHSALAIGGGKVMASGHDQPSAPWPAARPN